MNSIFDIVTSPTLWSVFGFLFAGLYLTYRITTPKTRIRRQEKLWLRRNYPVVILSGVALLAIVALTFYLVEIGISVRLLVDRLRATALDPASPIDHVQGLASSVAILVGVLAAAATILYSSIRVWINERTATASEEGLITDRINTAVQGLGAEKVVNRLGRTVRFKVDGVDGSYFEWIDTPQAPPANPDVIDGKVQLTNDPWSSFPDTQPNLEVRIGSVYALERIAQDSDRDHVQIMEILCAYIRQNAPFDPEQTIPEDWEDAWDAVRDADWDDENSPLPNRQVIKDWALGCDRPREDVQVALTVIGRRSAEQIALEGYHDTKGNWQGYRLDLRRTCLQRVDLAKANLANAQLSGAQMQGAVLFKAQMQGADLRKALLQGAVLKEAQLQKANLRWSQLQGGDLEDAVMQRADLREVQLQCANLTRTQMQKADLRIAQMQSVIGVSAQLKGAALRGARMQGANFSDAQMLGVSLRKVRMQGAYFTRARMQNTTLNRTRLQGAFLGGAQMQGAYIRRTEIDDSTDLRDANLRGASLRSVEWPFDVFSQEQIDAVFGDQTVILQEGLKHPDWPEIDEFDWEEFESRWRSWQARIGFDPEDSATW